MLDHFRLAGKSWEQREMLPHDPNQTATEDANVLEHLPRPKKKDLEYKLISRSNNLRSPVWEVPTLTDSYDSMSGREDKQER